MLFKAGADLRAIFWTLTVYVSLAALVGLTACVRVPDSGRSLPGSLLRRADDGTIREQSVLTDVKRNGSSLLVTARDAKNHRELVTARASHLKARGCWLQVPGFLPQPMRLIAETGDGDCLGGNDAERFVRICSGPSHILIEVDDAHRSPLLTLSGNLNPSGAAPAMETPKVFTLSEAVAVALRRNFNSRIEFEHAVQAKNTARQAYLNLLPHANMQTALSLASPSFVGMVGSVGDLAPFLLPNRWLLADTAKYQSDAERDAMTLMQADTANQTEGLAYILAKDVGIVEFYRMLMDRAMQAHDLIASLELQSAMPPESADHISAVLDSMREDLIGFEVILREDHRALSQTIGFINSEAVKDVTIDAETLPLANAKPLRTQDLRGEVFARSFELRQVDELTRSARSQKKELLYDWLDPAGDPRNGLGLGLGAALAVGQSRINEMIDKRQQLQSTLEQKLNDTVEEYNAALKLYVVQTSEQAEQERRLARVMTLIKPGTDLNTLDLEAILIDYIGSGVRQQVNLANFRIARSKIDRMLLRGYYAGISAVVPEPVTKPRKKHWGIFP